MKGIGPAGGLSMSRTLGTKVTLAGRTAFLPNDDVRHEGLAPVSREGRSVGEFWLMTYQHLWLFLFYQLGDCK